MNARANPSPSRPLLEISGVSKSFARRMGLFGARATGTGTADGHGDGAVQVLRDVSLEVYPGETLSVVGESGCGKTTLGRVASGMLAPDAGTVTLDGEPVRGSGRKTTLRIQTVPQDPYGSLDPRMRIGDQVTEGPVVHGRISKARRRDEAARWLERVGLGGSLAGRWPHELSGGQRQRVVIARALAMAPDVLVCDEPLASLDRSVQAQVLNLFLRLREELSLTLLFISHDLDVVRHLGGRTAVLYLGRVVELGPTEQVLTEPAHPYTRALIDCMPQLAIDGSPTKEILPIPGEVPSPASPPPGCPFHPRCALAVERCRTVLPTLEATGPGRWAACHLWEE